MRFALLLAVSVALVLGGCGQQQASSRKAIAQAAPERECEAIDAWVKDPNVPPSSSAAQKDPEDCFFYQLAWKNFLYATRENAAKEPEFAAYPNMATLFGANTEKSRFGSIAPNELSLSVRDVQRPNALSDHPSRMVSFADSARQAGGMFGVVVDGAGNPILYSIHVNAAFKAFIDDFEKNNGPITKANIESNPQVEFTPGVAEYKAAWRIAPTSASRDPNYIYADSTVPNFVQDAKGVLRISSGTRPVTLQLIALHVAFVIENHPEFVWATFEHVTPTGEPDLAPSAAHGDETAAIVAKPGVSYLLFAPAATRETANSPCPGKDTTACEKDQTFALYDASTQSFTRDGAAQQTSIFREFPASKSDGSADQDQSVMDLNASVGEMLAPAGGARDVRANYRLVGATWLEHPRDGDGRPGDFVLKRAFKNPPGQDLENRSRIVAGEDAMSSMALESFTQRERPSCFSCHDTRSVFSDEDDHVILKPALLNVSHVISRHLEHPN